MDYKLATDRDLTGGNKQGWSTADGLRQGLTTTYRYRQVWTKKEDTVRDGLQQKGIERRLAKKLLDFSRCR